MKHFCGAITLLAVARWSTLTVTAQSNVDLASCVPVGVESSQFNIQLMNMGENNVDERYVDAFVKAAERWSKVIVGDVPDVEAGVVDDWFSGRFSTPYNGAVDDLVIGYEIPSTLDGPGGTLGSAGSVFVRQTAGRQSAATISGVMRFEGGDLDQMPLDDVKAVILHEMGHVLGLVGVTGRCTSACQADNPGQRFAYSCPLAAAEYNEWAPGTLLLENSGGPGTACGHWEEDVFRSGESSEVMTGFFESNLFQPLSRVTVAALDDLGYTVDYCGADVWPATNETQQRFEVYRTSLASDMEVTMERLEPVGGVDEGNELTPWSDMMTEDTASSTQSSASSWTKYSYCTSLVVMGCLLWCLT